MGKLFGTDGMRGEADKYPMDAPTVFSVGRAVTGFFSSETGRPKIVVGRDTRVSGPAIESALQAGIISSGGTVCLTGVLPTPAIALITESVLAHAGIVISASHNPYTDNGIKIFSGQGLKLTDADQDALEKLISADRSDGKLSERAPEPDGLPPVVRLQDSADRYLRFLAGTLAPGFSLQGLKIVLDTANGATYQVAPDLFTRLGATLEVIHNRPNGININHQCGSEHTRDLENRVRDTGAAVGLAFDGDGDRLIAVDENGRKITGDQALLICAKALKRQNRLKNDLLVTTIMSNIGLNIACRKLGIHHHAADVGDRYVLEAMQRLGGVVGGEDSGHMIFLDYHKTGDGILAALQLIGAMLGEGKPLSELSKLMEVYPQKLINVAVGGKPDLSGVLPVRAVIQSVEARLKDSGRVLVRYSGTQNVCRVMVEGPGRQETDAFCEEIAGVIQQAIGRSAG